MSKAEIVQRLSEGYTVKEIAVNCGMNVSTLQKQIINLRDQRNCKNVAHLVAEYFRKGLIK